MTVYDVAIIGGGIAGAGLAAMIAGDARTIVMEMEDRPGYHTTGRSAAFYAETYGGPAVQPLTTASKPFFQSPPPGFSDVPLFGPRGCLHIAEADTLDHLAAMDRDFAASGVRLDPVDRAGMEAVLPALGPQWVEARSEPDCRDMDVAALHQGFLRVARRAGAEISCGAMVRGAERNGGRWLITTGAGVVKADIVVIAAGAWADEAAMLFGAAPVGIQPLRRTMVQATTLPAMRPDLPLVVDAAGRFYFRPEGASLWVSPHDETPDSAHDVQPEEMDIAVAVDRFEQAGQWRVSRITRAWAGLRSFTPDRAPVYGHDPKVPGLFWCAGQGGFGIQTAPAASAMAAAILLGRPGRFWSVDVDPARYDPARFAEIQ